MRPDELADAGQEEARGRRAACHLDGHLGAQAKRGPDELADGGVGGKGVAKGTQGRGNRRVCGGPQPRN